MTDERQQEDGYFHELGEEALAAIADPHLAPEWWFNVRTRQVEEGPQSLGSDRLGPFETREEAARAEEIIAQRSADWAADED